jgi:hypothetical protein
MTPQEKAKHLYLKFYSVPLYIKTVKECCHIAIDEIMIALESNNTGWNFLYWQEVKKEIDKL